MDKEMATALTALVAATVALLVGLVTALINRRNAGLNAVISQQMKHAEFRQQWINTLREQMAELRSKALVVPPEPALGGDGGARAAHIGSILASATMVRLMMDRNDEDYDRLMELIDEIEKDAQPVAAGGYQLSSATSRGDLKRFVAACQDILKREWEVTKADMHRLPEDYAAAKKRGRLRA